MAVVKRKFSSSTDGMGIKVVATTTVGTAIHTAVAGTTDGNYDEIYIYAYNGHTADVVLTIEFGAATVPDNNIIINIPYKAGKILVVPGFILQNERTVKAFASVANVVTITGYVNRMTD